MSYRIITWKDETYLWYKKKFLPLVVPSTIILKATVYSPSYAQAPSLFQRKFHSEPIVQSFDISPSLFQRKLHSEPIVQNFNAVNEKVQRVLSSQSIDVSFDSVNSQIQRRISSEVLSQSLSNCHIAGLQTYYPLLSMRRYSSQYFVQSGFVNDSGQ